MPTPATFVDAAFKLSGAMLPLDHGYLLFSAVSRLLPRLHQKHDWGVHPVFGVRQGPGQLVLNSSSLLKLRVPAEAVPELLVLSGATLEVAGQALKIGVPSLFPLVPAATLKARFATVKGFFAEDSAPFLGALRRQLAQVPGLGQDPERLHVEVGGRRVMRVGTHTIVGFPVLISGLDATASLAVQRTGLGGRRHMGAGLFVPPGRRS